MVKKSTKFRNCLFRHLSETFSFSEIVLRNFQFVQTVTAPSFIFLFLRSSHRPITAELSKIETLLVNSLEISKDAIVAKHPLTKGAPPMKKCFLLGIAQITSLPVTFLQHRLNFAGKSRFTALSRLWEGITRTKMCRRPL